jgi:hypothetical protein
MRSWDHGEVIQLTKLHYDPINTTPKAFLEKGEKIRLNTTLTQRPLANIYPHVPHWNRHNLYEINYIFHNLL